MANSYRIKQIIKYGLIVLAVMFVFNKSMEMFHSGFYTGGERYWWSRGNVPRPYGIEPRQDAQGDLTLTNLYRHLHNLEATNRIGVLEHAHIKLPGGGEGTNRQFDISEAFDREKMRIQKRIRDDIAAGRRPYSDAYAEGVPHTPLGGNFYECHMGDCQWDLDTQGKILGIPSVPGVRQPYY